MHVSSTLIISLFIYLLGLLLIGVISGRKNKNASDYLVGSKSLPTWIIILTLTATMFGGGMMVGRTQLGYNGGMLYFFYGLNAFIGYVFTAMMIKKMRGFSQYTTVTEFLEHRYGGKFIRTSCALLSLIALVGLTATQVNSLVAILTVMGFGNPLVIAFFCMLIIVALTVFGGFLAVTTTDAVQIIIVMVGVAWLTISTLGQNGGIGNIMERLQVLQAQGDVPSDYLQFFSEESIIPILALMIPGTMYMLIGQDGYQRLFACRNLHESRKAAIIGGFLMSLISMFPVIFGMVARLDFPELASEGTTASAMGLVIQKYLPGVGGGILLCAVLSAILSTGDSCLSAAGSHFITDIYCVFIDKNADLSSKKMLNVSRLFNLVAGIVALFLAFAMQGTTLVGMMVYCYNIYIGGAFIPVVLGIYWKKANRIGTAMGVVAGVITTVIGIAGFTLGPIPGELLAAVVALVVNIAVSLATQKSCPPIVMTEVAE